MAPSFQQQWTNNDPPQAQPATAKLITLAIHQMFKIVLNVPDDHVQGPNAACQLRTVQYVSSALHLRTAHAAGGTVDAQ